MNSCVALEWIKCVSALVYTLFYHTFLENKMFLYFFSIFAYILENDVIPFSTKTFRSHSWTQKPWNLPMTILKNSKGINSSLFFSEFHNSKKNTTAVYTFSIWPRCKTTYCTDQFNFTFNHHQITAKTNNHKKQLQVVYSIGNILFSLYCLGTGRLHCVDLL